MFVSISDPTAYGTLEAARTPPIPSSSPGPGIDSMEISPLPHKVPFVAEPQLDSTPMDGIEDDSAYEPDPMQDSPSEPARQCGGQP